MEISRTKQVHGGREISVAQLVAFSVLQSLLQRVQLKEFLIAIGMIQNEEIIYDGW